MEACEIQTPGDFIRALLDARGWSQRTLAAILNVNEGTITRVVKGKQVLSAELAVALEDVLGEPAGRFLALQSNWDIAAARNSVPRDPDRAIRRRVHGDLPIADMIKRGWLAVRDMHDAAAVETALLNFFCTDRVADIARLMDTAGAPPAQLAWLRRVVQIASKLPAAAPAPGAARAAIAELRALLGAAEAVALVPGILAEHGIRFVIVEALAGADADGACLWLNDRAPVVALALTDDRIDRFWLSLQRGLEHVLAGPQTTAVWRDGGTDGDAEPWPIASAPAGAFEVACDALDDFIARKIPFISEGDLIAFARVHRVHPGILAGQIQRRTGKYGGKHSRFHAHFTKVRAMVCRQGIGDGWGEVFLSETRPLIAAARAPALTVVA